MEDVGLPSLPRLDFSLLIGSSAFSFLIMHPQAAEPRDLEKSMVINNVFLVECKCFFQVMRMKS